MVTTALPPVTGRVAGTERPAAVATHDVTVLVGKEESRESRSHPLQQGGVVVNGGAAALDDRERQIRKRVGGEHPHVGDDRWGTGRLCHPLSGVPSGKPRSTTRETKVPVAMG